MEETKALALMSLKVETGNHEHNWYIPEILVWE